jgi:polyisoprenoid-binding protein YceI
MKKLNLLIAAFIVLIGSNLNAQTLKADVQKSSLKWLGKKVTGEHFGYIKLKEGSFIVKDDKIVSGTFIIDMSSISNTDIESDEYKAKLVGHLKSDDFFGVDKFPTSLLEITSSSKFVKDEAKVKGKLTIKDITHPVEFTVKRSGNTYTTEIVVDRAKYDVRYGSGSFFDNLGDKMIYDDFTMTVKVETK